MKINELLEKDILIEAITPKQNDELERALKSDEFKKLSEFMTLESKPTQLKNGTLVLYNKGLKERKVYEITVKIGIIKTKNEFGTIWSKIDERFAPPTNLYDYYIFAFNFILRHYKDWVEKVHNKLYNKSKDVYEIDNKGLNSLSEKRNLIPDSVTNLTVARNNISNFEAFPDVTNELIINNNDFESLKGCPASVQVLRAYNNKIVSIEGIPKNVKELILEKNKVQSIKECPQTVTFLNIANNQLESLEGCPTELNYFKASDNKINSLLFAPKSVDGTAFLSGNKITNLKGIGKDYLLEVKGSIYLDHNPIESYILGLLKVKGLSHVSLDNKMVESIINKHLKGDRNIVECAEELIENELKEFAKL